MKVAPDEHHGPPTVKKQTKPPALSWRAIRHSRNVIEINVPRLDYGEFSALLTSDWHWDNPHCDREKLAADLDEAVARGAPIFSIGDTFCAMQGKFDKRANKNSIRPEHQRGDYLDSLVSTCTDWLMPYRHNLALIGQGNHETAIYGRHETDLIERLTSRIRDRGGITQAGGYGGWVIFRFGVGSKIQPFRLYYHHGFGGGGPVTKGSIDWSRYLMHAEADAYVAGHVHYLNSDTMTRAELTMTNQVRKRNILFIRCSTYKDEYEDGFGGFHVEKGRGPRPIGGQWLHFKMVNASGFHGLKAAVTSTV